MTEVVYNTTYGGFSINEKLIKRMIELGSQKAKDLFEKGLYTYTYQKEEERYDPYLVQAVKDLGAEAGSLAIEVIDGDKFIIDEYDGLENVRTPNNIRWHVVQK